MNIERMSLMQWVSKANALNTSAGISMISSGKSYMIPLWIIL